ncbi:MAG: iron-sulfur cluster assembly scaffold protein [Candidatus Marsarchaeota archaeon]|nr:iron-sulfur cluster assembly scaffold protein [Candidatus Marsarchaeota archaeon]
MGLDMYAEALIQAFEHPQHKHEMDNATKSMHEENISCGDKITIHLRIGDGVVKEASFEGSGCVISMGSAEMLFGELKGKELSDIESMSREDILKIIKIDPGPVRMHCATLSLRAIKKAVLDYEKKPIDRATKEL